MDCRLNDVLVVRNRGNIKCRAITGKEELQPASVNAPPRIYLPPLPWRISWPIIWSE